MRSRKINEGEIADMRISSLPTRPTAPPSFGGRGYTPAEAKAAFDKLPLYIIERYNELIGDILGEDGESVADGIRTDISEGHTLKSLFEDIPSGAFAAYLSVGGASLDEQLTLINEKLNTLAARLGISF